MTAVSPPSPAVATSGSRAANGVSPLWVVPVREDRGLPVGGVTVSDDLTTIEAGRGRRRSAFDRYLAVSTALARGDGATFDGLPHLASQVSVNQLADALGVTRTALYRRWPTRHDLWMDLVRYAAFRADFSRREEDMPWAPPPETMEPVDLASPELLEIIRGQFNTSFQQASGDMAWVVRAAQLAYPETPELAAARSIVEQRRITTLAARIAIGLQRGRRRFKPGFTLTDLAALVWCLGDGLLVLAHWHPDIRDASITIDDGWGPRPWTLTGYAFRSVLFTLTEPIDPPGSTPLVTADLSALTELHAPEPEWTDAQRETLAVAMELLLERLVSPPADDHLSVLPQITVDRIARATGVSRRAVYDVWSTRDALLLDVLTALLDAEAAELGERIERGRGAAGPAPNLAALAQAILAPPQESSPLEQATLAFVPESRRAEVGEILLAHHERTVATLRSMLAELPVFERSPLEEVTLDQLAVMWLAIEAGARRMRRAMPGTCWLGNPGAVFGMGPAAMLTYRPSAWR